MERESESGPQGPGVECQEVLTPPCRHGELLECFRQVSDSPISFRKITLAT